VVLEGGFPVAVVCEALQVSRAAYYAWLSATDSRSQQRNRELMPHICDIFWMHKRRYGARRIAVELGAMGHRCGVDRVAKLMKPLGLAAIQPKSFKTKTTQSRHCLGYSPNLLLSAPPPGAIHHSDRGGQYAGAEYRSVLRRAGLRQSMSRAANCYDNAFMESCYGTVKTELELTEYDNINEARREIRSYIADYNLERRHSQLKYLSPCAFEEKYNPSN
jgi:transposase InsO family protein